MFHSNRLSIKITTSRHSNIFIRWRWQKFALTLSLPLKCRFENLRKNIELLQLQQLQRHEDIQQTEHISIQLQNLAFAKDCFNFASSYMKFQLGRNNTELQQLQRTTPPKPTPAVWLTTLTIQYGSCINTRILWSLTHSYLNHRSISKQIHVILVGYVLS